MTQIDAYDVVAARPPEPPEDPDPKAVAQAAQQALFAQEKAPGAWTAPLSPVRGGRQRLPVPPEDSGDVDARGTERGAWCVLDSNGTHRARGAHCPHNLPAPGDPDDVVATISF